MSEDSFYKTDSLALTSYLELKGLKFIKAELVEGNKGKVKVLFYFLDPKDQGRDLELEFRHSPEKSYRDGLFFYRKLIHELLGTG